jgi:hypothetical protein
MTVDTVTGLPRYAPPLEGELGYQSPLSPSYTLLGVPGGGLPQEAYTTRDNTELPELQFPRSSTVYNAMHRTDSQVVALEKAIAYPLIGAHWYLQGEGVDDRVISFLTTELGLDMVGGRARRRRQGIVWTETLRHALLMLRYGSSWFEPVYEAGPALPEQSVGLSLVHHLRKLGWRSPRTIREILIARDGGLLGLIQEAPPGMLTQPSTIQHGIFIPADRLVAFVNDREGADWGGQSILRSAYRNYIASDVMIRAGAQAVERNSMGVPVATIADESKRAQATRVVREFRAGARAGVVVSQGVSIDLIGTSGSTKDELPLLKWHNEQVAKSALNMVMSLGQSETGSRATAETFDDIFSRSLMAIGRNIAETMTEYVIRPLVERNFGPDEPYPVLTLDDISSDMLATPETLVALGTAGFLGDVSDLGPEMRRRLRLPQASAEPIAGDGELVDDTTEQDSEVPESVLSAMSGEWFEPAQSQFEQRLAAIDAERSVSFAGAPGVVDRSPGASRLRDYWTKGEGLAKWSTNAHPWTTLERLLRKHIENPQLRKATTTRWYYIVFHKYPASR